MLLRSLRNASRITRVRLQRTGLRNGAGETQGWNRAVGIDESRLGIRHRQHVRGFDAFPSPDARAIETKSFGKNFLGQFSNGTTEMLPGAEGVDKFNVDHFGPTLFR